MTMQISDIKNADDALNFITEQIVTRNVSRVDAPFIRGLIKQYGDLRVIESEHANMSLTLGALNAKGAA